MTEITRHAIQRYQQRISDLSDDQVRALLDTPAVRLAISFGAPYVKLGSGHRIALKQGAVVTVLPAGCPEWRLGVPKGASNAR